MHFDFGIFDKNQKLVAVFEVKARLGTTPEWAAKFRRNLRAHMGPPTADFFGFVTPERLYLWQEKRARPSSLPNFEADLTENFKRFAPPNSPSDVAFAFELRVASWLSQLLDEPSGAPAALRDSGLLAAAQGGYVASQVAA